MGRLAYAARGCAGSRGWCNPWWAIDYPLAEAHFLPALARMTRTQVAEDSRAVTLDDDALFDYPWIILQQPGTRRVASARRAGRAAARVPQARRLHDGRRLPRRVRVGVVPVGDAGSAARPADRRYPRRRSVARHRVRARQEDRRSRATGTLRFMRMEGPPHWRGIYDEHGRLMVAIGHNSDMGDGWEHADDPSLPDRV